MRTYNHKVIRRMIKMADFEGPCFALTYFLDFKSCKDCPGYDGNNKISHCTFLPPNTPSMEASAVRSKNIRAWLSTIPETVLFEVLL